MLVAAAVVRRGMTAMESKPSAVMGAARSARAGVRLGLTILIAVLFSVSHPSSTLAQSLSLSQTSIDFGPVALGTTGGPISVTATATLVGPRPSVLSWGFNDPDA